MVSQTLQPGQILQFDFWPELVRVLNVQRVGNRLKVGAVGHEPRRFHSSILSEVVIVLVFMRKTEKTPQPQEVDKWGEAPKGIRGP